MKPKRILVLGSSNTDMIIKLERIPQPGETLLGGEFATAPGGKGANQAVSAVRAGGRVTFIARVGMDILGDQAVAGFKHDGMDVAHVFRDPRSPSGVALIFVARNGENSIAVASGANGKLSPSDVRQAKPAFNGAEILLLQLETPLATVTAAAQLAAKTNVRVLLNPAPARALPDALLKLVSILTPNETEAELLTGIKVVDESSAAQAAKRLLDRGVHSVVITRGAQGAFLADARQQLAVPGFKVKPVDATAAGDTFNGALAVALTEGRPIEVAVRFANAAAAISVTRLGAQPSIPYRREIDRFLGRCSKKV